MKSFSQIGQDLFVARVLNNKRDGLFFDIGAAHPITINNTYMLERYLNWTGISIDVDPGASADWEISSRTSVFLDQDALEVNYNLMMSNLMVAYDRTRIDYLTIDLEPPINSLLVLRKIPFDSIQFSVVTFEHDLYRSNPGHKLVKQYILRQSREIFSRNGYNLVASNTQEDWWIHKSINHQEPILDINSTPK